jgi:hypothetical protein
MNNINLIAAYSEKLLEKEVGRGRKQAAKSTIGVGEPQPIG